MRDAFYDELARIFAEDDRVVFLTGDLGYKLFDPLTAIDADRVINFGIREAGMVGFAAGLARTGLRPFVYSIVPFITLRCLEQIKLDLCYHRARAVLVGVGGGFAYGMNGPTHHGIEDLGVLSCLPNMRLWTPGDGPEVRACVRASADLDGPAYLRLGRSGEPAIPGGAPEDITGPRLIRDGDGGAILCCGDIVHEVLRAADDLESRGVRARVIHLATLRPFPEEALAGLLDPLAPVLTVEEHVASGGLGMMTAELLAVRGRGRFHALRAPHAFPGQCLDRQELRAWAGLDAAAIVRAFVALTGRDGDR